MLSNVLHILALVLLLACPCLATTEYAFEDNVREALEAGEKNFAAGKLQDAEVDFENALVLDPDNVQAMTRLFDVYIKLHKKLPADRLLTRMKESGRIEAGKLAELEKTLDAGAKGAPAAQAATVTASAPAGGDVDDLEKELAKDSSPGLDALPGGDGPPDADPFATAAAPAPVKAPDTAAPVTPVAPEARPAPPDKDVSKMTPEEKFDRSVELAKQKDYQRAIPLYVAALQANNSLLARDDFGLRAISQSYYENRAKTEPGSAQTHFMLGWFAELDSRNDDALAAYKAVVAASKPGDSLHDFAKLKIEQIDALQQSLALAQKQEQERKKAEAQKAELSNIAAGKGTNLKPADYLKKAEEALAAWKKDKSAKALEEAGAYFEGAVAVDGKNPKVRLSYARMKIDEAVAGNASAKDVARKELQTALMLHPDEETKKQVQSLLDSLGPAKTASTTK